MKVDQLTDVFVKQAGARKEGTAYLVPHDAEASVFVALEGETLTIAKVVRVEIDATLVLLETVKHERFIVASEDVRAIKLDRAEAPRRERSAGFGK